MGTSSSYKGPSGTSALLPPWADGESDSVATSPAAASPPSETAEPPPKIQPTTVSASHHPPIPSVSWSGPKATVTSYASGGPSTARSSFRSYVRAHGGGSRAAHASASGRRSTRGVLAFLSDAAR